MKIEYKEINSLEEIVNHASEEILDGAGALNYLLPFTISIDAIKQQPIADVTAEAKLWADKTRPQELHINHGEFILDGLEHITTELLDKKTSNRALFSLLSQKDISNSHDQPIPSFMLMQCSIHDDSLYCTAYFRALEITKFFRINLEEIRLKISTIHDSIPDFKKVNITIFAFRAYSNKNINPLRIPLIDRMSESKICVALQKNPAYISELLLEKIGNSTVVKTESIERIISATQELSDACVKFNRVFINTLAKQALQISEKLRSQRKINSHHEGIEATNAELNEKIKKISEELNK